MAPKDSSLLEDPPGASTSDNEEGEEGESDDEVESGNGEDAEEFESDSDDLDKTPKKNTARNSAPKPQTPSSSEENDDDEETGNYESDSDDFDKFPKKTKPSDLNRNLNPNVKSGNSKPVVDTAPKPKKTVAKPTSSTASAPTKASAVKRPLESDKGEKDSKKKKKKVDDEDEDVHDEEDNSHPEEGEKKSDDPKKLFQRLWSDDDEIVILKGMSDWIKKGSDPTADLNEFLDSIKKSVHVNVNRDQLNNKIRRMKKKYQNNFKRGKGGEDPVFSKPHDLKCYELMKEIWSGKEGNSKRGADNNNGNDDSVLTNGKRSRKSRTTPVSPKRKTVALNDVSSKELPKEVEVRNSSLHPCLTVSLLANKNLPMVGESLLKEGLSLIGETKAKDMEKKWRKLHEAELEIYLKRIDLVREQTMVVLNAIKSGDS